MTHHMKCTSQCHYRQRRRNQRVVAGQRNSEEAPRSLVATHHHNILQPVQQPARGAERRGAGAFGGSLPPLPFDARMENTEIDAPQHQTGECDQSADDERARRATPCGKRDDQRQRNAGVVGHALLEAERTRPQLQHQFEEPCARDRRGAGNCNDQRSRHGRIGAPEGRSHVIVARRSQHGGSLPPLTPCVDDLAQTGLQQSLTRRLAPL